MSATYGKFSPSLVIAEDTTYTPNLVPASATDASETFGATTYINEIVKATTGGATLTVAQFTTITFVSVKNLDANNAVAFVSTQPAGAETISVPPGRTVVLATASIVSMTFTTASGTALCVVKIAGT